MTTVNIGIYGAAFAHKEKLSTVNKPPNKVDWTLNTTEGDFVFYMDHSIKKGVQDTHVDPERKCAWILESRPIVPRVYDFVNQNKSVLEKVFKHVYTHDRSLIDSMENAHFVPGMGNYVKTPKIYDKNELVCMITSNKTQTSGHKRRLRWAERLSESIDLYGRGFDPIPLKEDALAPYMFSIEVENAQYESYFTEKLHDALSCGTIPVYEGAPDIGDFYNEEGIIDLHEDFTVDELSEDLYYEKLDAVKENYHRSRKFEFIEDYLVEQYLIEG